MINPSDIEITTLVPHRPPVLMIDKLLSYSKVKGAGAYVVSATNPFVDADGVLNPFALIEVAAQAFAACNGFEVHLGEHDNTVGMIVAVRTFEVYQHVNVGDVLVTQISNSSIFGNFAVMHGSIFCGTTLIASVSMKVWSSNQLPG